MANVSNINNMMCLYLLSKTKIRNTEYSFCVEAHTHSVYINRCFLKQLPNMLEFFQTKCFIALILFFANTQKAYVSFH